ncbi:MAG: carboxypeptidase-like regulatory domain-containing protein [Candidatus Thermoplasmatota archaeon]|nr:carboxypeptidase-like regulatory domain-containing protein [Candidatus Thermoplasmatota archaeon]
MKGKARCPHCEKSVVVEVPDDATGEQVTTCPNCNMKFKVNVDEKYSWEEETPAIHPSMHLNERSMKPIIAGILLVLIFLSGIAISSALLFSFDNISSVNVPSEFGGTVVSEEGTAIEGVNVSVVGQPGLHAVTDNDGKFLIKNITSGKQKLRFTCEEYKSLTAKVFVLPWNITFPYEKFVMKEGSGEIEQKSLAIKVLEFGPTLSVFIIALSVAALVGGVMAIARKHFVIAFIGAVLGTIAGIFSIIGIILGIVALVLLILSKEEFETGPREVKY